MPSNFFGTVGGGVGYTILSTGGEDPLSHLRAAYGNPITSDSGTTDSALAAQSLVSRTNTHSILCHASAAMAYRDHRQAEVQASADTSARAIL